MSYPPRHVEWTGNYDEAIITLHWKSWWGFGKVKVVRYRGSLTVWRELKTGKRASTLVEATLSEVWTKAMWDK